MVVSGRSFASTRRNLPDAATCCLGISVAPGFWKAGKPAWVAVLRTPPNFPVRCFRHVRQARGVFAAHSPKPSGMFTVHPPKPIVRDVSVTPSKTKASTRVQSPPAPYDLTDAVFTPVHSPAQPQTKQNAISLESRH